MVWIGEGIPISFSADYTTEQCENNAKTACLFHTNFKSFKSCWVQQTQNCITAMNGSTARVLLENCEETEETRVVLLCLESVCQFVSYSVPIVEC